MSVMQTHLGLPGPGGDIGWDVGAELGGTRGLTRSVLVVPRGLDEQPPGVTVAGLGDVPSVLLLAGGVLTRCQPEVAHQLPGRREATEAADLCQQPSAVRVAMPRKEHSHATGSPHGSVVATCSSC